MGTGQLTSLDMLKTVRLGKDVSVRRRSPNDGKSVPSRVSSR